MVEGGNCVVSSGCSGVVVVVGCSARVGAGGCVLAPVLVSELDVVSCYTKVLLSSFLALDHSFIAVYSTGTAKGERQRGAASRSSANSSITSAS